MTGAILVAGYALLGMAIAAAGERATRAKLPPGESLDKHHVLWAARLLTVALWFPLIIWILLWASIRSRITPRT